MKRKLLLAALVVAGAVGFKAQAQETPTANGIYYVYNPLTEKFMGRGSSWGTRAIVDNYGVPIKLEETGGNYYLKCTDNELYMSDDTWMYTDGGNDGDNPRARIYTITPVDGKANTYTLTNNSNSLLLYVYLNDDNDKFCMAGNGTKGDNYTDDGQTQWQFLTQEQHDAIIATKQLNGHIAIATAAGYNVATESAFTTLLSNSFEAQDVTSIYLGNDNLNSNGAGNWTVNGVRKLDQDWATYVGGGNGVAESFSAATSLTKELTGLKAGIYKVTMNGFFRQGNNGVCWANKEAGFLPSNAYLQAGDYATALKAWGIAATKDGETYTPDNTTQANTAFNNNDYVNEVYTYVNESGNLTLSVNIPNFISWAGWACYNNVQMTYYRDKSADAVPVTAISLNPTTASATTGSTVTLTATLTPDNADDLSITWTSNDETVATVNNGVVTTLKPGTATITATANGGDNITATCTITVADATAPAFYSEIAAGDFYIVNAATGKFLGGANSWGTQASLIEHGIPFTVALSDGKYTLDSHTYNNETDHFFNGTYVDGASTLLFITPLSGGKYSISTADGSAYVSATSGSTVVANNATNANSSLAQWYFLSKTDRDKMLADATAENPVDATYYIKEANISRNLRVSYGQSGWTNISYGEDKNQDRSNYNAQVWNGSVNVYQTIENLPNGKYTLKMQGFTSGTVTLYANDEEVAVIEKPDGISTQSAAATAFTNGEYVNTLNVTVSDRTLKIGLKGDCSNGLWLCYDNFELYMTEYSPSADETDYENLANAISAAKAHVIGFEDGEYAPYNNIAALAALAAAEAIDPTVSNTPTFVQNATQALNDANWVQNNGEVNAVYDGTFAAAENNGAPAGWRMTNNTLGGAYHSRAFVGDERLAEFNETNSGMYLRFDGTNSSRGSMYYYGDTEGYTMPLKADTYYYVTVDFAGWGSSGKPLRMNVTGPEGFAKSQEFNTSVRADNANNNPQQFNILFKTSAAGNYVINFQTPGADTNTHAVVISNLKLFTQTEVTMTVKAGKYATFCAPFDVAIPEGVTAKTVDRVDTDGTTLVTTDVETTIPANTPVLLYNSASTDFNETFYGKPVEGERTVGLLTGIYATDGYVPQGSYVLQTQDGVQAFYYVDSSSFNPTPNRAYLKLSNSNAAKERVLFLEENEDATFISVISALTSGEVEAIYSVGGALLNGLQKGINIVKMRNGETKKVILK